MKTHTLETIGVIRTCFPEKFGIPRQPLLAPSVKGVLVLTPPFNHPDCVAGLEGVSHIWLTFIFHQHIDKGWKPKVRPPRLGGNTTMGVFATRSSFRPNQLGLSVVKLDQVVVENKQVFLHLSGVDLVDGTPIVDIKPYVPYADNVVGASNDLANAKPANMPVVFSEQALLFCASYTPAMAVDFQALIVEVLQQDPRPAYHDSEKKQRIYGIALLECDIQWRCVIDGQGVEGILVIEITRGELDRPVNK